MLHAYKSMLSDTSQLHLVVLMCHPNIVDGRMQQDYVCYEATGISVKNMTEGLDPYPSKAPTASCALDARP